MNMMKKFFLYLFSAILISGSVIIAPNKLEAQTIELGTGVAINGTTTSSPVNIYFRRTVAQFVYTAAELNAAGIFGPCELLDMGWYIHASPIYDIPGYTVKLKHVAQENVTTALGTTDWTTVKGPFLYNPTAGNWDLLGLDQTFTWNGVDNIGVEVCWSQVQPGWNSSGQCRIYSTFNGYRHTWTDGAGNSCGEIPTQLSTNKPQVRMVWACATDPPSSVQASSTTVCPGVEVQLTAIDPIGTVYWFDNGCNDVGEIGTGTTITVNPMQTTTYYARNNDSGLWSQTCASITIQVMEADNVTVTGGGTYCESTILTASLVQPINNPGSLIYWQGTNPTGTSLAQQTNTQTVTASGTYYFRARTPEGCWGEPGSATVTIDAPPTAPTGIIGNDLICIGESVELTAIGGSDGSGAIFEWFQGGCGAGNSIATGATITISPTQTTTYYVRRAGNTTCTNYTGCASITITVDNPPTAPTGVSGGGVVCTGHPATFAAVGGTIGSGANYIWYANACETGTILGTDSVLTFFPQIGVTYYVQRIGNSACKDTTDCASFEISYEDPPTAPTEILGENVVCTDYPVTLTASGGSEGGGVIYQWFKGGCGMGEVLGTQSTVTVYPSETTTYYVRRVGNTVCTDTTACASFTVSTIPTNTIMLISEPGTDNQIVCNNQNIINIVYEFTGATGVSYDNLPAGITGSHTSNTITLSGTPSDFGILPYTVELTGGCGQVTASGIITHLADIFSAGVETGDVKCHNDADGFANVIIQGGLPPYSIQWYQQGQVIGTGTKISKLNAGTYNLIVEDKNTCTEVVEFTINQPARIRVDKQIQNVSCYGYFDGKIEVEVTGGIEPYQILWSHGFTGLALDSLRSGTYTLRVIDANQCEHKEDIFLPEFPHECLRIPNAFSPNGDGINDVWKIDYLSKYPNAIINVFNRWGQLIFSARGTSDYWDGTWNGKPVPVGPYLYVIDLRDDKTTSYTGIVNVIY